MITIDVRWLNASGMGTYLRNIVPGILPAFPERRFVLIGDRDEVEQIGIPSSAKVDVVASSAKMYSMAEQFEIPKKIPKETRLYFAPHYNIPLLYRGKMLVTVYDLFHLAMPHLVGGFHKRIYARYMLDAVRRRADAILTISRFTRDELIRFTGEGRQTIFPIHLGVDESWFAAKSSSSPHGKPYLLYVGNIKPHKNLVGLIKAFGTLLDDIPHDLVLLGKKEGFITGDRSSVLEAGKLRGRVHFTGRVEDVILKSYMAHADALVFPSFYEGFGLPPLEAMAAGCPVISSNVASLPEICGDAALYCDPYSTADIAGKIGLLMRDGSLRDELRVKGEARARQFTWNACITETCGVIDGLLAS
ncbi:MAG: glycosyltransferase family 4 protein [Burkholderiales bacterium]|nr:glycosyltransferase family 4 protein [Burkholderiales bacterium]